MMVTVSPTPIKNHVFFFLLSALIFVSCGEQNGKNAVLVTNESEPVEPVFEVDTLDYPSDVIPVDRNEVSVYVSEDEKMRWYTWEVNTGGNRPDYDIKCQYRTSDGEVHIVDMGDDEGMSNPSVCGVHSVQKNDGTIIYLVIKDLSLSGGVGRSWVDAYLIDQDSLKSVNVCDEEDVHEGNMTSWYSMSDWYFRTIEGWDWLYEYDAEGEKIYVPETEGSYYYATLTDRYTVYYFNGEKFVPKRNQPHRGLHQSLSDYVNIELFFHTKNYIVRIDKLSNGKLRYASWNTPSSISDKPDLVIEGGQYFPNKDGLYLGVYTFVKGGYTYSCGNIPADGEDDHNSHEYLIVKKGNKVICKEERLSWHRLPE